MHLSVFYWLPNGEVAAVSPQTGWYWTSCVHPDGDHAIFAGGTFGDSRIFRADIPGGEAEPLTPAGQYSALGSYGALGDAIVYVSGGAPVRASLWSDTFNVFVMAPDGTGVRQLTDGPFHDVRPALSPDGSTVAFFSDRSGRYGLWTVPADGTGDPELLVDEVLGRPAWSLDGKTIYCYRTAPDNCQAAAVTVADGSWRLLANDVGHTHGMYVDFGGEHLIVHSAVGEGTSLYELPLDGSAVRPLIPPGFDGLNCAHGTRARNGVITFDHLVDGPPLSMEAEWAQAFPTKCWGELGVGRA